MNLIGGMDWTNGKSEGKAQCLFFLIPLRSASLALNPPAANPPRRHFILWAVNPVFAPGFGRLGRLRMSSQFLTAHPSLAWPWLPPGSLPSPALSRSLSLSRKAPIRFGGRIRRWRRDVAPAEMEGDRLDRALGLTLILYSVEHFSL